MQDKIAIGSDHAGFDAKEEIKRYLEDKGIEFEDFGTNSKDSCDYPVYAREVAKAVAKGACKRGIITCGSGIGVSIVANKVRGVRAALCHDAESATLSRQHNDSNVLCMAGRTAEKEDLTKILDAWLAAEFEGGRHERRVSQIEQPRAGEDTDTQAWYSIH